ncbi:hypothetical protein [Epilithonimonas mollis]|uniref:Redox-active disulfide protein 2 n=1 Tax=Epilithonimonas mollis TaxID=216903 RepID=A0A1M6NSH8_9FLAO|nr:hypothetical protein [Epilithonimonas mollis]SHJ98616.1 hypothetical protein SAMN05444371_0614 [Epilithonimonas mollis]
MKKTDNLSELTNDELLKKLKTAKTVYILFFIIFVLLLIACLYLTAIKGFSVFTILPLSFIPLLIANIMSYGKVKEEARSRNLF